MEIVVHRQQVLLIGACIRPTNPIELIDIPNFPQQSYAETILTCTPSHLLAQLQE